MYTNNDLVKNIYLDKTREERQRQIEDKKKNRAKYRNYFSSLQRQFRKGKRLNEVRTASKFFRDGVNSEFSH